MIDRVAQNPGRMLVTPEDGSAPFYATLTLADNPVTEGTPLNKANILTDATAALFGLTPDATPDEVFAKARELITTNTNNITSANTNANARARVVTGSYTGTGTESKTILIGYTPKLFFLTTSAANKIASGVWSNAGSRLINTLSSSTYSAYFTIASALSITITANSSSSSYYDWYNGSGVSYVWVAIC